MGCGQAETESRGLDHGAEWNVVRESVRIPMRDGVRLAATLFRPDAPGPFPAIVYRTPYDQARTADGARLPLAAAKRGYLVFLVDVRGRYASEGEFEAYRNEGPDGHDTIEWVASLPYCDGKVGTYGGSYPGYLQWLTMAEDPPHLAAAAPDMTPVSSHHFFYQGGAFSHAWYEWFMPLILPDLRRRAGDRSGPWDTQTAAAEWERERERWYAHRPLADVPLLRRYAPYFYEWQSHPDEDEFWAFANVEDDFHRMRAPALILSGWYDDAYGPAGATRGFRGMRAEAATPEAREGTRLILGPWTHTSLTVRTTTSGDLDFGPSAGVDFDALLLDWFDRWLKGIRNGVDESPPARYFVMGENRWRTSETWPPADAVPTPFYLASGGRANTAAGDGRLARAAPATAVANPASDAVPAAAVADRYTFDPRDPVRTPNFERQGALPQADVEAREDVLVYTSETLTEPLTIAGELMVELYVSSDAPDTDFAFMLTDVHPDGTSYNLGSAEAGLLRMRYRDGFDRQVSMEPGTVYRITIGGLYTAVRFDPGHRIRLQVTSSRYPVLDPNPNTGTEIATEARLVPAQQTVYHDAERPSRVVLPVVPSR